MSLLISTHARTRMIQRNISEQDIEQILNKPKGISRQGPKIKYYGYTKQKISTTVVYDTIYNMIVTCWH